MRISNALMPTQGKHMDYEGFRKHARAPHDLCRFGVILTWKTGTLTSHSWTLCGLFYHLRNFRPFSLYFCHTDLYNELQLAKKRNKRKHQETYQSNINTNEQKYALSSWLWTVYFPRKLKPLETLVSSLMISRFQDPASAVCPSSLNPWNKY